MAAASPLSWSDALRLYHCGAAQDVEAAFSTSVPSGTPGLIVRAARFMRGGDVAQARRVLSGAMEANGSAEERCAVADAFAGLLMSVNDLDRAETVLAEATPGRNLWLRSGIAAQSSILAANRGDRDGSAAAAERADELLGFVEDPGQRAPVLQRLALAAQKRGDHVAAEELGFSAAQASEEAGLHRAAAYSYAIPLMVAIDVRQDPRMAFYLAERVWLCADRAGEKPMVTWALVSQAVIAAESGNELRLTPVAARLMRALSPQQFTERFNVSLALAFPAAWKGNFGLFRSSILMLKPLLPGQRALKEAFIAVCFHADGEQDEARMAARRALHLAVSVPEGRESSVLHDRRLARAIASWVARAVGDVVRGERAMATKDLVSTAEASLLDAGREHVAVRGYARVLAEAQRASSRSSAALSANHGLTPAQIEVLRLLASGRTLPDLAHDAGRSVETLKTHAKRAYSRLGVSNRFEAVERARSLGLL